MKSDAYDDLERELTAVYEPIVRDPHDVAALRRLAEVLHRQFGPNAQESESLGAVCVKLAHDRAVSEVEHEFIVWTAQLALEDYRNGF